MSDIFGLPQPLTGSELITIHQMQNGQLAECSMPLSDFIQFLGSSNLPTSPPSNPGIVWDNGGMLSIS